LRLNGALTQIQTASVLSPIAGTKIEQAAKPPILVPAQISGQLFLPSGKAKHSCNFINPSTTS